MYSPTIENWSLYFLFLDGYENRDKVAKDFTRFYSTPSMRKFDSPGRYLINGNVYDDIDHVQGEEIFIVPTTLERIGKDVFCITLKSGAKYYIYASEVSKRTKNLMRDASRNTLVNRRWHYVAKRFHTPKLI